MRPIRTVLAAVISAALLASAPGCDAGATEETAADILIAADLELSGAAAAIGTAYDRALRLKASQINDSGVLGGRRITLDVKDNRSDKTLSQSNIAQFARDTRVNAVVTGACGECVLAAAKSINDRKLPTISLAAAGDVASPVAERPYIFKIGPNPTDSAAVLASEISSAKLERIGLITTSDSYGDGAQQAMEDEAKNSDGDDAGNSPDLRIVATRSFKTTDTDVSQAVRQVVDLKPQALVVWALAEQAQLVASSARAADFDGPLYFDAAAAGDLFLNGAEGPATEGSTMIFTQTLTVDDVVATTPAKAARKQWFRDYTSQYGSYYGPASFAADALQTIVDAITRADSTDGDRIRAALENTQLDGLSGPIRITPANHSGLMPQAMVALVARTGRWRLKV